MDEISYSIYVESDEGYCPSSYDMAREMEEAPSLLDLAPIPPMTKWIKFKKWTPDQIWEDQKGCDNLSDSKIQ